MRSRAAALLPLLAARLLAAAPAAAQETAQTMAAECATPVAELGPLLDAPCRDAVLVLAAARAGVGLAAAQGSAVPGSASTLGRRMASSPRIALSLRGGLARAPLADPGDGSGPPAEETVWPRTLEGQVTIGLLEGWSPLPTVGGFLSLDLVGALGLVSLSESSGFEESVLEAGYGARLGVFRESFTLPGVSASIVRRHIGEVGFGPDAGDGARATFTPVVTSLRATVAKDLLAFGVLAGWGWDRYGGQSRVQVTRAALAVPPAGGASSEDFHTDRQLFYGGLSYTLLVLQLSAEGGWARGWSGPDGSGGWDPSAGTPFGSIAARVTY